MHPNHLLEWEFMDAIRSFIAIELSPEMQAQLSQVLHKLKEQIPTGVRWVPAGSIHLTLKFLGESSPNNIAILSKSLPAIVERYAGFELSIGQLGAFPNLRRPRVIWVGVQAPSILSELQHSIERETQHLGYGPEERSFSPHLTLGRVNQNASPQEVSQIAAALSRLTIHHLGNLLVEKVVLFRSELLPGGARYTPIAKAMLKI